MQKVGRDFNKLCEQYFCPHDQN